MTWRFLKGNDTEFDYSTVDESDDFDDWAEEQRHEEDKYFEQEEPSWMLDDGDNEKSPREKTLEGETGVQDF